MRREHRYEVEVVWTGNLGSGTSAYTAYGRDHELRVPGKSMIAGSSDPSFRGNVGRWNPEELFVASVSACHKLWYLHLCADAGVVVTSYLDQAEGIMIEEDGGEGQFASVVLRPKVIVSPESDTDLAQRLHKAAHEMCFIARSVAFPITHEAVVVAAHAPALE
jgi:organic hydroperoxide reductase OsmC/OhrA